MTKREFVERFCILADNYETNCLPVGEIVQAIHEVEDDLAKGNTDWIVKWLEDDIKEYGWDEDYVNAAKELLNVLMEGDIHE